MANNIRRMRTHSLLLFVMLTLTYCKQSESDERIEYYKSGSIKRKQEMKDTLKNGKETTYYKSGEVSSTAYWKNDTANGILETYYKSGQIKSRKILVKGRTSGLATEYYENGNVKSLGTYLNGQAISNRVFYYANGNLSKVESMQVVKGTSVIGQYLAFDEQGNLLKSQSYYLTINPKRDTITVGEDYEVAITLENSYYDKVRIITANYDEQFNLLNKQDVDTTNGSQGQVMLKRKADQPGKATIRGYVDDFKIDYSRGYPSEVARVIYFELQYYVKSKPVSAVKAAI